MRPKHLEMFLKRAIPNKWNVLIAGSPGIGKTDIVLKACKDLGVQCRISHPVVSDPTDYKGLPFLTKEERSDGIVDVAKFLPFDDLLFLIEVRTPTLFFLDDLGQAPASVQAAAMQLILGGRINGHKISNEVGFVAATNRREDKAGVQGILEPVKSRFVTIITLETDEDDWGKWAFENNMPPELISFVKFFKNNRGGIFNFKPSMSVTEQSCCPRTIAGAGRMIREGLPPEVEFEVLKGAVGEAVATEFAAFLKIYRNLPDPDDVLKSPKTYKLPDAKLKPDVLYALLGSIAARASKKNFEAIVTLSDRLPAEFSVMLVKDATMKDPTLCETDAFTTWATTHDDLID